MTLRSMNIKIFVILALLLGGFMASAAPARNSQRGGRCADEMTAPAIQNFKFFSGPLSERFEPLKNLLSRGLERNAFRNTGGKVELVRSFMRSRERDQNPDIVALCYVWHRYALVRHGIILGVGGLFSSAVAQNLSHYNFSLQSMSAADKNNFLAALYSVFENGTNARTDYSESFEREALMVKPFFNLFPREQKVNIEAKLVQYYQTLPEELTVLDRYGFDENNSYTDEMRTADLAQFHAVGAQAARKKLGLSYTPMNHYVHYIEGNELKVIAFSTEPFDSREPTDAKAIFVKVITTFAPRGRGGERTISWTTGGETQELRVKYTKNWTPRLSRSSRPNYSQMLADGSLGGFIILPHHQEFARTLSQYYVEYYKENGFRFKRKARTIRNLEQLHDFITSKVASGEVDYMLRDGHGGFDERELIRLGNSATVYEGVRPASRGHTRETVTILVIGGVHIPGRRSEFTNTDMRLAMRSRPSPENQLLYIEGACSQSDGICEATAAVAAPGFVAVASNEMEETFAGDGSTHLDVLVDGLRQMKTYAQIRQATQRLKYDEEMALHRQNVEAGIAMRGDAPRLRDYLDEYQGFVLPSTPEYPTERNMDRWSGDLPSYDFEVTEP